MKKITEWFREQPRSGKVQIIVASALTISSLAAFPVMAWFSNKRELKTATYVNAPINLYITATHESVNPKINLGDIDINNKDVTGKYQRDYVFCVRNIDVGNYILQLACTTNTPFKYEIFEAKYIGDAEGTAQVEENGAKSFSLKNEYDESTKYTENGTTFIYEDEVKGKVYVYERYGSNLLNQTPLNPKGDTGLANDTYIAKSYETYTIVQQNVNPLYFQSGDLLLGGNNLIVTDSEVSEYYILRVSWTQKQIEDGEVSNDKETDLVYITAGNKPD